MKKFKWFSRSLRCVRAALHLSTHERTILIPKHQMALGKGNHRH